MTMCNMTIFESYYFKVLRVKKAVDASVLGG